MARDFGPEALPVEDRYFPTAGASPVQRDMWSAILKAADELYTACVMDNEQAGWAIVNANIIVAFWGRGSVVNQRYGIRAKEVLESRDVGGALADVDLVGVGRLFGRIR